VKNTTHKQVSLIQNNSAKSKTKRRIHQWGSKPYPGL